MKNDSMSVTDVIVIETAASDSINAIRSGTGSFGDVLRQAASITNVSSMPMPVKVSAQLGEENISCYSEAEPYINSANLQ